MIQVLRVDAYRMFCKKWFWLCLTFMLMLAVTFIMIQATALDYTVDLDRVIFLPMSFYGVAIGAFISLFVGEDFSDGFIKNKIIAGKSRRIIYFSAMLVSCCGCIVIYLLTVILAIALGAQLFYVNVTSVQIMQYLLLGVVTSVVYGSLFCMISMLNGNKAVSVTICMLLSFAMLFLCLHTNQFLVQNPALVTGMKRVVYEYLYDFNPTGQAAQLSSMKCLNPGRYLLADLLWELIFIIGGLYLFEKKDVN